MRHILDVEEQDWLLREDVAKGFLIIAIPKISIKYPKYQILCLKPNTPNVLLQIHTVFGVNFHVSKSDRVEM